MNELQVLQVRKVTIFDSATNFLKTYETATTSWSDIVALLTADGFSLKDKDAILGSTKGHLVLPEAQIPTGDQKIFTVQAKMKSGAVDKFKDMTYLELRRACKGLETGSSPTKISLIKLLEQSSGIKATKSIKAKKEIMNTVKRKVVDSTPLLEERITALEQTLGQMYSVFYENYAKLVNKPEIKPIISNSIYDLQREAAELESMLRGGKISTLSDNSSKDDND